MNPASRKVAEPVARRAAPVDSKAEAQPKEPNGCASLSYNFTHDWSRSAVSNKKWYNYFVVTTPAESTPESAGRRRGA